MDFRLLHYPKFVFLILILFLSNNLAAQGSAFIDEKEAQPENSLYQLYQMDFSTAEDIIIGNNSLAIKPVYNNKWGKVNLPDDVVDMSYKPWDSEKHFGVAVGELAIVEFIPWAFAKWGRTWEDPSKNWANVGFNTWWENLNNGWEYDGDNFLTNYFAHPYHGNLYFNVGRTNGYSFWESTAWAFTGSAAWEYFGEFYRPAFNDWVNTSVNGINLGEMTYRLSTMVTDNTATGWDRFWGEFFGTVINPVRGFNRIISGEITKTFPNPEWRKPDEFHLLMNAGFRKLHSENASDVIKDGIDEGVIGADLIYGNTFKAKEPFSSFRLSILLASGQPKLTKLESSGFLYGITLKNTEQTKHKFNLNLEYGYYNNFKQDEEDSLKYDGILYGATNLYPHLLSIFNLWGETKLITQAGANLVLMGATPNDYYYDEEGRNYDFGPGVGLRFIAALHKGEWDYVRVGYYGLWLWTMSEPADSKHHLRTIFIDLQLPINDYFAFGIGANLYWRHSQYLEYYDDNPGFNPDVRKEHSVVRLFFTTAIF